MRRAMPGPDPDLSVLPTVVIVASLVAFVLFVSQFLLSPAVLGALLGVGGAALTALLTVALSRRAVTAVLDYRDADTEEADRSTVEATPTD